MCSRENETEMARSDFRHLTTISAFGIGNMVQANSISSMVNETFHIAPWISGVVMAVLTAFVILVELRR